MIVSKVGARSGRTDDLDLEMRRKWWAKQEDLQQYDAWLARKVENSRVSAEAGNLIPASDVEAHFATSRAATRARKTPPE